MEAVSIELFKEHVYYDESSGRELALRQSLEAATEAVVLATGRSMEELVEMGGGNFPATLAQAVLMLGASNFAHPENADTSQYHELPHGASALIKPWVKLAD